MNPSLVAALIGFMSSGIGFVFEVRRVKREGRRWTEAFLNLVPYTPILLVSIAALIASYV